MNLNEILSWYQIKIGSYDKQSWEQKVEQYILRGFGNAPKKSTKLKTEFIDVDLVRGTTYPKAKCKHGVLGITWKAFMRILFMPFYMQWWKKETSKTLTWLLLGAYVMQLSSMFIFFTHYFNKEWEEISTAEVMSPAFFMVVLGIIHSQVVSTYYPKSSSMLFGSNSKKRLRRRRQSKLVGKPALGARRLYQNGVSSESNSKSNSSKENLSEFITKSDLRNFSLMPQSVSTDSGVSEQISPLVMRNGNDDAKYNCFEQDDDDDGDDDIDQRGDSSSNRNFRRGYMDVPNVNEDATSDEAKQDSAVQDVSSIDAETDQLPSDTEAKNIDRVKKMNMNAFEGKPYMMRRRISSGVHILLHDHQHRRPLTSNSSGDSDAEMPPPETSYKERAFPPFMEYGMTTNTDGEEQANGSDFSEPTSRSQNSPSFPDDIGYEINGMSASSTSNFNLSCSASEKVSCTVWEGRECKKVKLCVLDISSAIVRKVAMMPQSIDYFVYGIILAIGIAMMPLVYKNYEEVRQLFNSLTSDNIMSKYLCEISVPQYEDFLGVKNNIISFFVGRKILVDYVMLTVIIERFFISVLFFFLLSVAERTFKQRFLHAKLFTHLTTWRRSRRSELPYIHLNKVNNIKTWLSVRSYLKKHGPQRSVDMIVSIAFFMAFTFVAFLCIQILKGNEAMGDSLYNWEAFFWIFALSIYLLRFLTLSVKINKKYRNFSAILTEQINLQMQMDQKPHKKEGLILANNVLKLSLKLLKELESPFKFSGLSTNPFLFNLIVLVIFSALSAVLTELLGFKLKLYKIKIK